jgi:hypothetical protein
MNCKLTGYPILSALYAERMGKYEPRLTQTPRPVC